MKNTDQILLEKAYEEVLRTDEGLKQTLATAAVGAGLFGSSLFGSTPSNDFVSSRIQTITQNVPKQVGSSYIGNVEAHKYLELAKSLTEIEKQKINTAAKTLGSQAAMNMMNQIIASKNVTLKGNQKSEPNSISKKISTKTVISPDFE